MARAVPGVPAPLVAGPPPEPDDVEALLVLDLALGCGEMVLAGGAGASDATATVTAVARACGLRRVDVDVAFTSLTVCWVRDPTAVPVVRVRVVRQRWLDYGLLEGVAALVQDLVDGRCDRAGAARRLQEVRARAPRRGPRATTAGSAVLAAAVSVLLGAGVLGTAVALVVAAAVAVVVRWTWSRRLPLFFVQAAGALTAGLAAVGLAGVGAPLRPSLVVAGGVVLLLTGTTLVGAVQDALTGFYVTGGARAFEALLLTAGITAGIATALVVGQRLDVVVLARAPEAYAPSALLPSAGGAAVAAAAFAYVYQSSRRTLPSAAAVGAVGLVVYRLASETAALPATLAAASAAVVVGLLAHVLAWRQNAPALLFATAGIVPLLPGLLIYNGLLVLAVGDTARGSRRCRRPRRSGSRWPAGRCWGSCWPRRGTGRTRGTARPAGDCGCPGGAVPPPPSASPAWQARADVPPGRGGRETGVDDVPQRHLDRLSSIDAGFLLEEDRGDAHMHIGGLVVCPGPAPDIADFRNHIADRLHLVPRYRQRVVDAPLGTGRPLWAEDPQFNLEYHVRHTALPAPGTDEQLKALVGRIVGQRLDRRRPLWEMWLVEGLEGGRWALINKTPPRAGRRRRRRGHPHRPGGPDRRGPAGRGAAVAAAPQPGDVDAAAACGGEHRRAGDVGGRARREGRDGPGGGGALGRRAGPGGRRAAVAVRRRPGAGDAVERPGRSAPPLRDDAAAAGGLQDRQGRPGRDGQRRGADGGRRRAGGVPAQPRGDPAAGPGGVRAAERPHR